MRGGFISASNPVRGATYRVIASTAGLTVAASTAGDIARSSPLGGGGAWIRGGIELMKRRA
jgi:hypothetical protein